MMRVLALLAGIGLVLVVGLAACAIGAGETATTTEPAAATMPAAHQHPMAAAEEMPAEVLAAPERTQEAYRFAFANPAAAAEVPCYCGCVGLGHISSYDCYFSATAGERPVLEPHALNCDVCVSITQDQMRLMDGGASWAAIRRYLEMNYGDFGPPTPLTAPVETLGGMGEHG